MQYVIMLAAILSLLVTHMPTARADGSAPLKKIIEQVAESLDAAELPPAAKAAVLRDFKQSLTKALGLDAEEQRSADDEPSEDQPPDAEADTGADAEDAEARQDRRERLRARTARRQQRWEQRRPAAAESRPADATPDEPERRRPGTQQDSAPQPNRFAIGVMLEESGNADGEVQLAITDVFPGSPAAEADLQSGDVIRRLDGEALSDPSEIARRIDQAGREGKAVVLEIGRDDDVLTVEVKPAARPGNLAFEFSRPDWAFPAAPGMPGFGGWRGPQWRFPTPPQDANIDRVTEIIERIERQQQVIEQLQQSIEELQQQRPAGPEAEEDEEDEED